MVEKYSGGMCSTEGHIGKVDKRRDSARAQQRETPATLQKRPSGEEQKGLKATPLVMYGDQHKPLVQA